MANCQKCNTISVNTKLLNCPFCGGTASVQVGSEGLGPDHIWVECDVCNARSRDLEADFEYAARDLVIEAWNKRV